jgi:CRP/FNR family transcriptional regulator, cyclic AMP receptor protein
MHVAARCGHRLVYDYAPIHPSAHMVSIEESLKGIPLFAGLPQEEIATLAAAAIVRTYPKNAMVVTEGDRSDSLYVILSGRVKVFVSDEDGKDLVLNFEGPGEYFGELALDEGPRTASVATLERCKMAVIPNEVLKTFLASHPDAALHLIRLLIGRARHMTNSLKSLAMLDVYGRVAKLLLDLAREVDGKLVVEERLTQQNIADRVSASREMISRVLKDLTAGGYIATEGGKILIQRRLPRAW